MLWLFLAPLGCAPMAPFDASEETAPHASDELVVAEPAVIDFGVVDVNLGEDGPQLVQLPGFTVYNPDDEATILHGQNDVIGSAEFGVQVESDPQSLAANQVVQFPVSFWPQQDGEYSGQISLNFGDAVVELRGTAHAPRLDVADSIEIATPIGCATEHAITVSNIGHALLSLDPNDLSKEGPESGLAWTSDEPVEIAPGETAELGLVFAPTDDAPYVITAPIQTNEPGAPIRQVQIQAQGAIAAPALETFRFDTDLQASLLIVPDTRPEMAPTLTSFAAAAASLVDALSGSEQNDVNIAVVTGLDDLPCPMAWYNTSDPKVATAGIAEGILTAGDATGHLLDLALGATFEMESGGCLDGFLRPSTLLHVLLISNGAEESYNSPQALAQSIANQARKLDATQTTLSVFVPDGADCETDECARYLAAQSELNGSVWDLLGTPSTTYAGFGATLVPLNHEVPLVLSQRAQQPTIAVTAGPNDIDGSWFDYNAGLQAVMLRADAPIAAGAFVNVSYVPSSLCD